MAFPSFQENNSYYVLPALISECPSTVSFELLLGINYRLFVAFCDRGANQKAFPVTLLISEPSM